MRVQSKPTRKSVAVAVLTAALITPILGTAPSVATSEAQDVGIVESFETATVVENGIRLTGWVYDTARPSETARIWVRVDGKSAAGYVAGGPSASFHSRFPAVQSHHGFDLTIPATPGHHELCVFGDESGETITCRTVELPRYPGSGPGSSVMPETCKSGITSDPRQVNPGGNVDAVEACIRELASGVTVTFDWRDRANVTGWSNSDYWAGWSLFSPDSRTKILTLTNSIATDWGRNRDALSAAMHGAGVAARLRCPMVAADTVFRRQSGNAEQRTRWRFATAFAIAHNAPSRAGAGERGYGIAISDAEIDQAKRC